MSYVTKLFSVFISFSLCSISFMPYALAKNDKNVSVKNALKHIFFQDEFQGNTLNGHLITVDLTKPMIDIDLALAYNNTNRKESLTGNCTESWCNCSS